MDAEIKRIRDEIRKQMKPYKDKLIDLDKEFKEYLRKSKEKN